MEVLAIEAAKGREFDHVFVLGLSAGLGARAPFRVALRRGAGRVAQGAPAGRRGTRRPLQAAPARGDHEGARGGGPGVGRGLQRRHPRGPRTCSRRSARRSALRRRSTRRSSSARPRASIRRSGSCATSCWTPWPAWAGSWARCGSIRPWTSRTPWSRFLELIKVAALIDRSAGGPGARGGSRGGQLAAGPGRHARAA